MLLIISLMVVGILIGFIWVSRDKSGKLLRYCGKTQNAATCILLFAMGLWLGGNPEFWQNISTTGLYGLFFAITTIAGSVIATYFLSKPLRNKKKEEQQ